MEPASSNLANVGIRLLTEGIPVGEAVATAADTGGGFRILTLVRGYWWMVAITAVGVAVELLLTGEDEPSEELLTLKSLADPFKPNDKVSLSLEERRLRRRSNAEETDPPTEPNSNVMPARIRLEGDYADAVGRVFPVHESGGPFDPTLTRASSGTDKSQRGLERSSGVTHGRDITEPGVSDSDTPDLNEMRECQAWTEAHWDALIGFLEEPRTTPELEGATASHGVGAFIWIEGGQANLKLVYTPEFKRRIKSGERTGAEVRALTGALLIAAKTIDSSARSRIGAPPLLIDILDHMIEAGWHRRSWNEIIIGLRPEEQRIGVIRTRREGFQSSENGSAAPRGPLPTFDEAIKKQTLVPLRIKPEYKVPSERLDVRDHAEPLNADDAQRVIDTWTEQQQEGQTVSVAGVAQHENVSFAQAVQALNEYSQKRTQTPVPLSNWDTLVLISDINLLGVQRGCEVFSLSPDEYAALQKRVPEILYNVSQSIVEAQGFTNERMLRALRQVRTRRVQLTQNIMVGGRQELVTGNLLEVASYLDQATSPAVLKRKRRDLLEEVARARSHLDDGSIPYYALRRAFSQYLNRLPGGLVTLPIYRFERHTMEDTYVTLRKNLGVNEAADLLLRLYYITSQNLEEAEGVMAELQFIVTHGERRIARQQRSSLSQQEVEDDADLDGDLSAGEPDPDLRTDRDPAVEAIDALTRALGDAAQAAEAVETEKAERAAEAERKRLQRQLEKETERIRHAEVAAARETFDPNRVWLGYSKERAEGIATLITETLGIKFERAKILAEGLRLLRGKPADDVLNYINRQTSRKVRDIQRFMMRAQELLNTDAKTLSTTTEAQNGATDSPLPVDPPDPLEVERARAEQRRNDILRIRERVSFRRPSLVDLNAMLENWARDESSMSSDEINACLALEALSRAGYPRDLMRPEFHGFKHIIQYRHNDQGPIQFNYLRKDEYWIVEIGNRLRLAFNWDETNKRVTNAHVVDYHN